MGEVADFFNDHPGGAESIMLVAGEDATEDFMAIQSSDARRHSGDIQAKTIEKDDDPPGSFLHPK